LHKSGPNGSNIYRGAALRENLISIKPALMNFDFLLPNLFHGKKGGFLLMRYSVLYKIINFKIIEFRELYATALKIYVERFS